MDVKYLFDWLLAQILFTVDTSTFEIYLDDMRSLIYDQLLHPETIILNRCDETTKKLYLKSNVKAVNKNAQLVYETRGGQIVELGDDEIPFDLYADIMRVANDDYGLWHMGVLECPRKHEGKSVELEGKVIATCVDRMPSAFVLRRCTMVCCIDDASLVGLLCHYEHVSNLIPKDWVSITTQIAVGSGEEYQGGAPVLHVKQLIKILPLDDEPTYFN